jgi:hypothetical protein
MALRRESVPIEARISSPAGYNQGRLGNLPDVAWVPDGSGHERPGFLDLIAGKRSAAQKVICCLRYTALLLPRSRDGAA